MRSKSYTYAYDAWSHLNYTPDHTLPQLNLQISTHLSDQSILMGILRLSDGLWRYVWGYVLLVQILSLTTCWGH